MNFRIAALLPLPLVLIACATNPAEDTAQVVDGKATCERSYRVGSMMPVKDCAPPPTPEERARMQEELSRIRPTGTAPPGK